MPERYMKDTAGDMCAGSAMTACSEMKRALCAMPVPNPPGMMYSDSSQLVWPCQRRRRAR